MPTITLILAGWLLAQAPLSVRPGSGGISGNIQLQDGRPASGLRVRALTVGGALEAEGALVVQVTKTDDAGNYVFNDLPPGAYYAAAGLLDAPSYFPGAATESNAQPVRVSLGTVVPRIDFKLATPLAVKIVGRLIRTDAEANSAPPVRVLLSGPQAYSADAQPNGSFEIDNVRPGIYQATITPSPLVRMPPVRIDARAKEMVEVSLFVKEEPRPTGTELQALLQSSSIEDRAWGMWLAAKFEMREMAPPIKEMLLKQLQNQGPDMVMIEYAMDALIRVEARLPMTAIEQLYPHNKAAALILLRRASPDADEFLQAIIDRERDYPWLVAANLLLERESPGFVFKLLRDLRIRGYVTVTNQGEYFGLSGLLTGPAIGDTFARHPLGFPPVPRYTLQKKGGVLLVSGPVPVYFDRTVSRPGTQRAGDLYNASIPSTDDKLKYAGAGATGLGVDLRDEENHHVEWRGPEAFSTEVARIRESYHSRYAALIKALTDTGKLTADEATSVKALRLEMVNIDFRSVHSPPLP